MLLSRKGFCPDDLEVLGHGSLGGLPADPVMFFTGAVAGLAVDARLSPRGLVSVGLEIVVAS